MKTLFSLSLAATLFLSSIASYASEDLKALSTVNSTFKKVRVTLKEGVGTAKISILNQDGKSLNKRKVNVKDESVVIPYDLNDLPAGEYQVRIETDLEEVTYTVNTTNKPVDVNSLPLMAYGKTIDENTVNLLVVGLNEPGVQVQIISIRNDEVIFEEHIDQLDGFKKDYSFNGVKSDEIYFKLEDSTGRSKTLFF